MARVGTLPFLANTRLGAATWGPGWRASRGTGRLEPDTWDRYWKSRRGYLEKVLPRENLKLRDVPKANPRAQPKGLPSEYPVAFRFSLEGTFFRFHPRLFQYLSDFCFLEVQGHSPLGVVWVRLWKSRGEI